MLKHRLPLGQRLVIAAIIIAIVLLVKHERAKYHSAPVSAAPAPVTSETGSISPQQPKTIVSSTNPEVTDKNPVKTSTFLSVPFIVQAPNANWDAVHEEACEEASLTTVYYYRAHHQVANLNAGDTDITALLSWETLHSYPSSITLQQLADIAAGYYGLKTGRIITSPTANDIKKEITAGRPVIVPAAGKILPNPNFRNGGPNYHMLVIKGYDDRGFITDDPGTRKGDGFRYTYNGLLNAIHDWNPDNILNGQRAVLVFD